ncbi:MAG: hypothetical protein WCK51_00850 [Armatimonadota bacterium]
MNHVGPLVKEWATFYSVLAGATATLLGLLFVAVSLHGRVLHEKQNSAFFRLARLTLSNYLMLLSYSLQMIVPVEREIQFRIMWTVVGLVGLFWTIRLFFETKRLGVKPDPFIMRSYRVSAMTYCFCVLLGQFYFTNFKETLLFAMMPALSLTFGSIRNSWGLLTMVQSDQVSS